MRGDKNASSDSFGLVALSSVGPVLAVLILGMFFSPSEAAYPVSTRSMESPTLADTPMDIQRFMDLADTEPLVTPSTWRFSTWMAGSALTI